MNKAIGVTEARDALAALPGETSYGETPAPEHVYLPRSHLKALDLDALLVTGMRGAGKTFWWSALQDHEHTSIHQPVRCAVSIERGY